MSTEAIFNYRKVNEQFITGGQPQEEQLQSAAEEGYRVVINLAPIGRSSLPDEEGLVRSLGMDYHYIPVDWNNPQESDFAEFERVMQTLTEEKTLIHCAANFRVTAFYSLYALKHLGWSEPQADAFRASVWEGSDYPIWEEFIERMKDRVTQGA